MKEKSLLQWGKWIRHGKYQIKNVNGRDYISPVPESGFIYYDFNELNQKKSRRKPHKNILVEHLLNLNKSSKEEILNFVNRFGLLGLLQHYYLDPQVVNIDGKKYYFVPTRNEYEQKSITEIAQNYLLNPLELMDLQISDYEVRSTMSEPLDEFQEAVDEFQLMAKLFFAIKRAENGISGPLRAEFMGDNHFERKIAHNTEIESLIGIAKTRIEISIYFGNRGLIRRTHYIGNGRWEFLWGFESLLSAAYFFFTQEISGNTWVGKCPRCSNLFLSSVSTKIYCSRRCEDAARKAKSRGKEGGAKDGRSD